MAGSIGGWGALLLVATMRLPVVFAGEECFPWQHDPTYSRDEGWLGYGQYCRYSTSSSATWFEGGRSDDKFNYPNRDLCNQGTCQCTCQSGICTTQTGWDLNKDHWTNCAIIRNNFFKTYNAGYGCFQSKATCKACPAGKWSSDCGCFKIWGKPFEWTYSEQLTGEARSKHISLAQIASMNPLGLSNTLLPYDPDGYTSNDCKYDWVAYYRKVKGWSDAQIAHQFGVYSVDWGCSEGSCSDTCAYGYYSPLGNTRECIPWSICSAGSYPTSGRSDNNVNCIPCPMGSYCGGGNNPAVNGPQKCPVGSWQNAEGSSSCRSINPVARPGETAPRTGMTSPEWHCVAGTYYDSSKQASGEYACVKCGAGKYNLGWNGVSNHECWGCPARSVISPDQTKCTCQTPADNVWGVFGTDPSLTEFQHSQECKSCDLIVPCQAYQYIVKCNQTTSTVCANCTGYGHPSYCPAGQEPDLACTGLLWAGPKCRRCQPGYMRSSALPPAACQVCPVGFYRGDTSDATGCQPCTGLQANKTFVAWSSPVRDACPQVCVPGYYADASGACVPCAAGRYAPGLNTTACLACTLAPDSLLAASVSAPVVGESLANRSSYWLTQAPGAAVANSCPWECMSGYEKNPTARVYECLPCSLGQYSLATALSQGGLATRCQACAAPCVVVPGATVRWESAACLPWQNRVCSTCPLSCPTGQWISQVCGGKTPLMCTPCRTVCNMGEYKSPSEAACTGGTSYDPVRCLPCTSSCSRGNYIAGRCDGYGTFDPGCRACTVRSCVGGFLQGCGAYADSRCEPYTACPVGQYLYGEDAARDGTCRSCTDCGARGLGTYRTCDAVSDSVCFSGFCDATTPCSADQRQYCADLPGTDTSVCAPCPKGYTSDGWNCHRCPTGVTCDRWGSVACNFQCPVGRQASCASTYSSAVDPLLSPVTCAAACEQGLEVQLVNHPLRVILRGGYSDPSFASQDCYPYFRCAAGAYLHYQTTGELDCEPCDPASRPAFNSEFFSEGLAVDNPQSCLWRCAPNVSTWANGSCQAVRDVVTANPAGWYGFSSFLTCPPFYTSQAEAAATLADCIPCPSPPPNALSDGASRLCGWICDEGTVQQGGVCVFLHACVGVGRTSAGTTRCATTPLPWQRAGRQLTSPGSALNLTSSSNASSRTARQLRAGLSYRVVPTPPDPYVSNPLYACTAPFKQCVAGTYCPAWGVSAACPAGYYCPSGVSSPLNCTRVGAYCPVGSAAPVNCTAGYYCTSPANRTQCPLGFYCPEGSYQITACPYCPESTRGTLACPYCSQDANGTLVCLPDTPGAYCAPGSAAPGNCTAGYYCTSPANRTVCPAGYYCLEGVNTSTVCLVIPGLYCPEGTPAPASCPAGYFCPTLTTRTQCPAGYYCPSGSDIVRACPNPPLGVYCPAGSSAVGSCTAGYYCPSASTQTPCPVGSYCPAGSGAAALCTGAGKYCPNGTSAPLTCAAGYYCPTVSTQTACPAGFYCAAGSTAFSGCALGSYCPAGSSAPVACAAGYFCPSASTRTPCPAGSYCPAGSSASTTCAGVGAYCPAGSSTPLLNCSAGYYCSNASSQAQCALGTYCPVGSTAPTSCLVGYYCPAPANQTRCVGGYCPAGSSAQGNCTAGYYCANPSSRVACGAGSYCPAGSVTPTPCPSGAYCPAGASAPANCTALGSYCPAGSSAQANCTVGYYCATAQGRVACAVGTYCPAGSYTVDPCPAGFYCPNASAAVRCSPGQYCASGSTASATCPSSYYCAVASAKTVCPAGFRCPAGASAPANCTAGYYCPVATFQPILCGAGSYCPVGSAAPAYCQEGYYCPSPTTQIVCPLGSVCVRGALTYKACTGLASGMYCPAGSSAPGACTAGYTCSSPSSRTLCPLGSYCPSGSSVATLCSTQGTFCAAGSSAPVACAAGYYCPTRSNQTQCPVGYSCLASVTGPTQCTTPSTYCPPGSSAPAPCPAGNYCPSPNSSVVCPVGYYCPVGSTSPTLCAGPGLYCPPGTSAPGLCPAGYFCPCLG